MSVDIIGMIQSRKQSEIHAASGPAVNRDYVRAFAQAHEQAGFDRILVPHHSTGPSAALTIAYAAAVTERIHFLLAHRPGFVAPTLAAREIATLDQFSGGRLGVHFISGGSDDEQRRDGDYLSHDERYARTDEYLGILNFGGASEAALGVAADQGDRVDQRLWTAVARETGGRSNSTGLVTPSMPGRPGNLIRQWRRPAAMRVCW